MTKYLAALLLLVISACATTSDIRGADPSVQDRFDGSQNELAACVAHELAGNYDLTPVIDPEGATSTVSSTMKDGFSGNQMLMWELTFTQLRASSVYVALRGRESVLVHYGRNTDIWQAVERCGSR